MLALQVSDARSGVLVLVGDTGVGGGSLLDGCARSGQDSRARTKGVFAECRQKRDA